MSRLPSSKSDCAAAASPPAQAGRDPKVPQGAARTTTTSAARALREEAREREPDWDGGMVITFDRREMRAARSASLRSPSAEEAALAVWLARPPSHPRSTRAEVDRPA